MVEIDDKLNEKLRQQINNQLDENEEMKLRLIAKSYAMCENSIAVLSNLQIDKSYIYYGKTSDILGLDYIGRFEKIDSIWEEKILDRIHPEDQRRRNLLELAFLHFITTSHTHNAFDWHMENTLRMADKSGKCQPVFHRIFYFQGKGQRGVGYAIVFSTLQPMQAKWPS